MCDFLNTYTCKEKNLWGFYIKKYLKGLILFCSLVQCYLTLKINDFLDVTEMHKAEIAAENEELKHYGPYVRASTQKTEQPSTGIRRIKAVSATQTISTSEGNG